MYNIKEKVFKNLYFIVLFLFLFIVANSIHNSNLNEIRLDHSAENSFNKMRLNSQQQIIHELEDLASGNYDGNRELTEYSLRFESLYFKYLIYNKITLEKAFSEFEKSESFNFSKINYKEEYKNNYIKLKSDTSLSKKLIGEIIIWGISALDLILLMIETPLSLITSLILLFGFYLIVKWTYPSIFKSVFNIKIGGK